MTRQPPRRWWWWWGWWCASLWGCIAAESSPPPTSLYYDEVAVTIVEWLTDYGLLDPVSLEPMPFAKEASQATTAVFFLAIHHFNERATGMFPPLSRLDANCSTRIRVVSHCDDSGDRRRGMKLVRELGEETDVFTGGGSAAKLYEAQAAQNFYGAPFVIHSAAPASPAQYHMLSQMQLSVADYTDRLADLIAWLGYKRIACLYMDFDLVPAYKDAVSERLRREYGTFTYAFSYEFLNAASVEVALRKIRETDVNVILFLGFSNELRDTVADAATANGLNTDENLWIFTRYDTLPTAEEMSMNGNLSRLMLGSIALADDVGNATMGRAAFEAGWESYASLVPFINAHVSPRGGGVGVSNDSSGCEERGTTSETRDLPVYDGCRWDRLDYRFAADFFSPRTLRYRNGLWPRIYDAVMTIGIAACDARRPAHSLEGGRMNRTRLRDAIARVDFHGMSGRIKFASVGGGGDRGGWGARTGDDGSALASRPSRSRSHSPSHHQLEAG